MWWLWAAESPVPRWVRGEAICCWGVAELLRLDLEKPLLDGGGSYADRFVGFEEISCRLVVGAWPGKGGRRSVEPEAIDRILTLT